MQVDGKDRRTRKQRHRQVDRETQKRTDRQRDRQVDRETDRLTGRQIDRWKETQKRTDRGEQRDRQVINSSWWKINNHNKLKTLRHERFDRFVDIDRFFVRVRGPGLKPKRV